MKAVPCLAALLVLAGCLSPAAPMPPRFDPLWSEKALADSKEHDHTDPLQHLNLSTPNFSVLGHDPLNSPYYGQAPGATLCGDAQATTDGRRIAAVESRSKVGFSIADVTDPAHPKWLGEVVMENTHVYDVAVVPDGKHVAAVTSQLENLPVGLPFAAASWNSACAPSQPIPRRGLAATTDPVPSTSSILLFDISDPANPAIVDEQPISGYGHSVYSAAIDGRTWFVVTTLGPFPPVVPPQTYSGWMFYELQQTPAGSRLNLLSTYYVRGDATKGETSGKYAHDGWIAKHPGTGQVLAYLVGGDRLTILDMADPMQPKAIATWSDAVPGREGYDANFHSVVPLDNLWNGKHYTIVGPEFGNHPADIPSGIVWLLDTTDPAAPHEVAGWTLPHDVNWTGEYMFSNHYLTAVNQTMFVSMYHGGVWAVDLSPVLTGNATAFVSLPSIGVFMPVDPAAKPAVKVRWSPTLEEVLPMPDGSLVTFDSYSGLWTFRFDANDPAPAPAPWPIVPPHASH